MLKVAKFGGSSVSSAEQFRKVKEIVLSDLSRKVIVVSVAGKRNSEDHKLTDLLYLCHAHLTYGVSCEDIFQNISLRFIEIRDSLGLSYPIENDLKLLKSQLTKDISVDYVGRIRDDLTSEDGLTIWCCGDQIRKGAATNAVQILQLLIGK